MNVTRYKCSVLAVDDDPTILAVLTAQLSTDFDVVTAGTAAQARAELSRRSVDIVLSDLQLPDESGLSLLNWVRRAAPRTARVLITGTARMQDAADAINNSQVHRLILKPWRAEDLLQTLRTVAREFLLERSHEHLLEELRTLNQGLERRVRMRTEELHVLNQELEQRVQIRTEELRKLNQELEQRVQTRTRELEEANQNLEQANKNLALANLNLEKMAATDELTGLSNRRAIDKIAQKELERRARFPGPTALLVIDADHFREVNRVYSLTAGDEVLRWLAKILQSSIRTTDSIGRVGGEEFLVVAPETDRAGAEVLAERLRAEVKARHMIYTADSKSHTIRMTISIGVAVAEAGVSATFQQLRATAVDAEKEAKEAGRDRAVIRELPALAVG